ncbi:Gfo/Idh/MocA family protein [Staphylococcus aureus]
MTKLKVGVIGVGGIAQDRHIPALLVTQDRAPLVAVQDINTVQMIDVAKRFIYLRQLRHLASCLNLLMRWSFVYQEFYADLSIEALNHGVHVLCEKPMQMTHEECDRMIEAEKNQKLLNCRLSLSSHRCRYDC